jgi:hypothetical protein
MNEEQQIRLLSKVGIFESLPKDELRACADRLATFHTCRFSERLNGLLISL